MIRNSFVLIKGNENGKKDIFHDRILMESGALYDMASGGIPIVVSDRVLKSAVIPTEIPFQIYHDGKVVGTAKNIYWNGSHALCGDIHVEPKYNKEVIQEIQRGNSGLSIRFNDMERSFKTYRLAESMELVHLALVPIPACDNAFVA